ncbi:uncharacterized protein LOC113041623 [Carassius auratus]|uniref:Uncharacterized protein LOC113041623 n=1 Tax=Carassius auratus TaxID=7957 RepID=A0A6P6J6Q8_CARAU|nr:uncharacterized protein LOC113041623 [Carassius auratus]
MCRAVQNTRLVAREDLLKFNCRATSLENTLEQILHTFFFMLGPPLMDNLFTFNSRCSSLSRSAVDARGKTPPSSSSAISIWGTIRLFPTRDWTSEVRWLIFMSIFSSVSRIALSTAATQKIDLLQYSRLDFPVSNKKYLVFWFAKEPYWSSKGELVDEHSSRFHDGLPEGCPLELRKMGMDEHSSCRYDGLPERFPLELRKMEWGEQHTSCLRHGLAETYAVELRKVE